MDEPNQTFFITLSAPVNATIGTAGSTVTIADATLLSARVNASIGRPVDPRALDAAADAVLAIDPGRAALLWAAGLFAVVLVLWFLLRDQGKDDKKNRPGIVDPVVSIV